ncbi:hypothetical protein CVM73_20245 [Bradyrhizobium forestalis]|uniref:Uncharacterized protein n=1 Tax=Bradyrhizobium forestalis TaxID=1419263 RepID=A0A2M8R6R6_9BRAD|nr:hypothetical protein CVM73_20245 [Bradyrhizobium forestalis]
MSLISICDVDLRPLRSTGHSFLDPAKLQRTPNYAGAAKRRRLMRAFAIRQASGSLQHTFPIIVAKQIWQILRPTRAGSALLFRA